MVWMKLIGNIGKKIVKAGDETYNPKSKRTKKTKKRKTKKRKTMKKGALKKFAGNVGREALQYISYKQAKGEIPVKTKIGGETVKLPTIEKNTFKILGREIPKKTVYLTGGVLIAGLIGYKLLKRK